MLLKGWMCPKGIQESFWDTSGAPGALLALFWTRGCSCHLLPMV